MSEKNEKRENKKEKFVVPFRLSAKRKTTTIVNADENMKKEERREEKRREEGILTF